MCGIAGVVSHESSDALVQQVERTLIALAHRGPDDSGILVFAPRETVAFTIDGAGRRAELPTPPTADAASVVLGNRRLAIIDPTPGGHQPMVSADGRYALVVNGEIYNYLELRRELEARGRQFRSRSDTEVLLYALAEWGPACLPRLVGMFAFALLDRTSRRLLLARDPFGMKPLYYVTRPGSLAFASEIPPLLPLLEGRPRANVQRVYDYLESATTDCGDETMFAGVRALPSSHCVIVSLEHPDRLLPVAYWKPDLDRTLDLSYSDAARQLRQLFLESVSLHLRSDTRVGTLLSGGLDSSSLVMAMRHLRGPELAIDTFSYIGEQDAINEEPWIDRVNAAAGATPHKVRLRAEDWASDADHLIESQNEPFASPAIYVQHRVFRRAAETGVKVTLDGQGGDELLAGYRSHWVARLTSMLERARAGQAVRFVRHMARLHQTYDPAVRQVVFQALKEALPTGVRSVLRRVRDRDPAWISASWCRRHGVAQQVHHGSLARGSQRLRGVLWRDAQRGKLPALLRYADRNAMAHSVESRLPFLTPQLAEFLLALPEEFLIGPDATSKRVFREAMRGLVPEEVLARKDKIGFSVPVRAWLPAIPAVLELLHCAAQLPPVEGAMILPAITQLRAGRELPPTLSFLMWRLATFAAWARRFDVLLD